MNEQWSFPETRADGTPSEPCTHADEFKRAFFDLVGAPIHRLARKIEEQQQTDRTKGLS